MHPEGKFSQDFKLLKFFEQQFKKKYGTKTLDIQGVKQS